MSWAWQRHRPGFLLVGHRDICRAPMAAALLRHKLTLAGAPGFAAIRSAGTHVLDRRELFDPRVARMLEHHEIPFRHHRAQPLRVKDLACFDHVLAMDEEILEHLHLICLPSMAHRVQLVTAWCRPLRHQEIPSPHFGNFAGLERAFNMLDTALDSLVWRTLGVREEPLSCPLS